MLIQIHNRGLLLFVFYLLVSLFFFVTSKVCHQLWQMLPLHSDFSNSEIILNGEQCNGQLGGAK